jgi:hypothetical protein
MMKRMVLMLTLLGAGACGEGMTLSSGSCSITPPGGSKTCIDYSAASLDMWKTGCANGTGTWTDGACTHTNAVGGCKSSQDGVTIITWLYAPVTTAIAMQACQAPSVFVSP